MHIRPGLASTSVPRQKCVAGIDQDGWGRVSDESEVGPNLLVAVLVADGDVPVEQPECKVLAVVGPAAITAGHVLSSDRLCVKQLGGRVLGSERPCVKQWGPRVRQWPYVQLEPSIPYVLGDGFLLRRPQPCTSTDSGTEDRRRLVWASADQKKAHQSRWQWQKQAAA